MLKTHTPRVVGSGLIDEEVVKTYDSLDDVVRIFHASLQSSQQASPLGRQDPKEVFNYPTSSAQSE